MKTIYIASDHRGFKLKQEILKYVKELESKNQKFVLNDYEIKDLGPQKYKKTDDYTFYAKKTYEELKKNNKNNLKKAILICGSGKGMTIAANKFPNIYASEIANKDQARIDRKEHNSNIMVISADKYLQTDFTNISEKKKLIYLIETWLHSDPTLGRHLRRYNHIRFQDHLNSFYHSNPLIVPSILSDSLIQIQKIIEIFSHICPIINLDYIDNKFVKGKSLKFDDYKRLIMNNHHLFTFHLMVKNPYPLLEKINNFKNLAQVIIHIESEINIKKILDNEWSFDLGIAINPDTKIKSKIEDDYTKMKVDHDVSRKEIDIKLIKKFPIVQLMTVEPGAQGRKFIDNVLGKISFLRNQGFQGQIHLDGGVNIDSLKSILNFHEKFQIDLLNIGSALVKSDDLMKQYIDLTYLVNKSGLCKKGYI